MDTGRPRLNMTRQLVQAIIDDRKYTLNVSKVWNHYQVSSPKYMKKYPKVEPITEGGEVSKEHYHVLSQMFNHLLDGDKRCLFFIRNDGWGMDIQKVGSEFIVYGLRIDPYAYADIFMKYSQENNTSGQLYLVTLGDL